MAFQMSLNPPPIYVALTPEQYQALKFLAPWITPVNEVPKKPVKKISQKRQEMDERALQAFKKKYPFS